MGNEGATARRSPEENSEGKAVTSSETRSILSKNYIIFKRYFSGNDVPYLEFGLWSISPTTMTILFFSAALVLPKTSLTVSNKY